MAEKRKVYIVAGTHHSYDDNNFWREEGHSHVDGVFKTLKDAQAAADERTADAAETDDEWLEKVGPAGEEARTSPLSEILIPSWEQFAGFLRAEGIPLPFHLSRPEILDDENHVFKGEAGGAGRVWDAMNDWWAVIGRSARRIVAPMIDVEEYTVLTHDLE